MSDQQTRSVDGQQTADSGPGSQLRDERLRRDMTVEEVARGLRLARATIVNIEQDNYEALPPLTFVRGYFRSYSELLGIDPDPLIAQLKQVRLVNEDSALRPGPGVDSAGRRRHSLAAAPGGALPVITLSIVLLVAVAGTAGWLLSREDADSVVDQVEDDGSMSPVETEPAEPDPAEPEPAEPDPVGAELAGPEVSGLSADDPGDPAVDAESRAPALTTDPVPETPAPPDLASAPGPDSADGASPDPAETAGTNGEAFGLETELPDADPIAEGLPVESNDLAERFENLDFAFTGESWLEVTDARGERLTFGLATSGEEQLVGLPPFEIVIGDVNSVSLDFRGESVNLDQHARGDVARFTLGDQ